MEATAVRLFCGEFSLFFPKNNCRKTFENMFSNSVKCFFLSKSLGVC
jgi:hypothetical protein